MLKIKFMGQLVRPTEILDAQKAPLHAMLHDLSGFFPRLEITSGFQKVSVKLKFFWEGQLKPGTAQPQPTLPVNPGQAGTKGFFGRSREHHRSLLPFSPGFPGLRPRVWLPLACGRGQGQEGEASGGHSASSTSSLGPTHLPTAAIGVGSLQMS